MSYATAEVLGRVERRRRFSIEQKLAVLREAVAPGANMSEVARRHGLLPAQVYKWRRLAELGVIGVPGASELPSFVAVEIAHEVPSLPAPVSAAEPTAGGWGAASPAAQESWADRDRAKRMPYTMIVPTTWPDGSLKFAGFLCRVGVSIAGSGTLSLVVKNQGSAPGSGGLVTSMNDVYYVPDSDVLGYSADPSTASTDLDRPNQHTFRY